MHKRSTADVMILLSMMVIVIAIIWNPYYLKQELNLFESGLYLPGIDAVSQGQVPFRDFFHLRGPFELYAPALFMKIFGFRADILASYFYVGTVITILAAMLIAYELIGQRLLFCSFALILVTRTFPRVVYTFWGGMRYAWGLLAIWGIIRFLKSKHPAWLVAAGSLAAIGCWTSVEIGVIVLFAFMVLAVLDREYRRCAWFFLGGFLAVSAPYCVYLLIKNAFMPYLQAQWIVVTHMGRTFLQTEPVPDTIPKFLHAVFFPLDKNFYQVTPVYCYIFFFTFYSWRMSQKKITVLEQCALVVAVYGLTLFLTGFRNLWASEYEMSLQPEKIVLFYLLSQAIIEARRNFPKWRWVGALLLAAFVISSGVYVAGRFKTRFYKYSWVSHLVKAKNKGKPELINGSPVSRIDLPRIAHMVIPLWQAEDLKQLKRFVDLHVPVHEAIWMYPELGSLNFILQRPWVGRFPIATLSWMDEDWFAEYEASLERNPPRYAIVNKVMPFYFDTMYFLVPANRQKNERMMRFLHDHYVLETQTPTYFIYERIKA